MGKCKDYFVARIQLNYVRRTRNVRLIVYNMGEDKENEVFNSCKKLVFGWLFIRI